MGEGLQVVSSLLGVSSMLGKRQAHEKGQENSGRPGLFK